MAANNIFLQDQLAEATRWRIVLSLYALKPYYLGLF